MIIMMIMLIVRRTKGRTQWRKVQKNLDSFFFTVCKYKQLYVFNIFLIIIVLSVYQILEGEAGWFLHFGQHKSRGSPMWTGKQINGKVQRITKGRGNHVNSTYYWSFSIVQNSAANSINRWPETQDSCSGLESSGEEGWEVRKFVLSSNGMTK